MTMRHKKNTGRYDYGEPSGLSLKGTLKMNSSVKLGRLYSVPVGLHWSWFLIFILLSWSLANGIFAIQFPNQQPSLHWGLGVITALLLFASVLAHEFGHAVISIRNRIPVQQITLFIFGGVAQISREPQSPGVEFRIAIAGPLVSLFLALTFGVTAWVADSVPVLSSVARWLAEINLSLVLFNMIPSFPLDGGRVLRSAIWAWNHNYKKATRAATLIGQGISYVFIVAGIFFISRGALSNGIWLAFIGWFLHNTAVASRRYAEEHGLLADVRAHQVMDRRIAEIPADLTVCDLVTGKVMLGGKRSFIVTGERHPLGMVTMQEIYALPRKQWEYTPVRNVMVPWERLVQVSPTSALSSVLQTMVSANVRKVPVVYDNRVEGILSQDQIHQFFQDGRS
jgi:Zn-dependent protease